MIRVCYVSRIATDADVDIEHGLLGEDECQ